MELYRIGRLFDPRSGRCLNVAVDHGLFGEPAFLRGIENMPSAIEVLVSARPDAVQLTRGQAPLLQSVPGKAKPALVLRADVANVYGTPMDSHLFSTHFPDAVVEAVRLDACCVVANLLHLEGQPQIRERCIETIMALRADCTRFAMPLMIEPLVMREHSGGYAGDGTEAKVVSLVRQARELGADLIKADPTDDIAIYHRVVEAAVVPVLVRGGSKVSDEDLLSRTHKVLEQGATGVVYGRNIIQHERPAGIVRAIMAILHEEASVDEALRILAAA
jgi:DhnA family fructose-bisphosphate aldolase class Ia